MSENTTNERPRRRSTQGRYRPPTWRSLVVIVSFAAAFAVYLFVNAPPPLAAAAPAGARIPIHTVFTMLDNENAAARALWTDEIVARGTAVGLTFDEHWRDDSVHAGPLPALFLRETARNLQRTPSRLNLFLGSQHPLNAANQFTGEQAQHFAALVEKHAPQYFVDTRTAITHPWDPAGDAVLGPYQSATVTLRPRTSLETASAQAGLWVFATIEPDGSNSAGMSAQPIHLAVGQVSVQGVRRGLDAAARRRCLAELFTGRDYNCNTQLGLTTVH